VHVRIDTVLLKVASRCNLNCSYCYVYNMGDEAWRGLPKRLRPDTQERAIRQLGELYRRQDYPFAVVLHGGEPLLLGATRLSELLGDIRTTLSPLCSVSIQTNGVLITNEILDICATHSVSLSVSLDGPADIHDACRVDWRDRPTHAAVVAGIETLKRHSAARRLFSGVLAVVDPTSSPAQVYDYFKGLGVPSVDFLYRDGNRSSLPNGKAAIESVEYGTWMTGILHAYIADPEPPRIRVLDDMIKLILGSSGVKEGVGLTDFGIAVIDTDGSITKTDTLKSSAPGDRFAKPWSVHTHELAEVVQSEEFASYHRQQRPTSPVCRTCPELKVCGGGMLTHRYDAQNGYDNPSVFCADQMLVIAHLREVLAGHLAVAAAA
jgi:uncharacterized protein